MSNPSPLQCRVFAETLPNMLDIRELCEIAARGLGRTAGRGALGVLCFRMRLYAILKLT
jgi:hypothetical protein